LFIHTKEWVAPKEPLMDEKRAGDKKNENVRHAKDGQEKQEYDKKRVDNGSEENNKNEEDDKNE
jgi:hypothetical protein